MNPLIPCKTTILPLLITGVLGCFGFLPKAQAVVPAPDGGYPNFNTAEGQDALLSLNTGTGIANTAVGWVSLESNVNGGFNSALGAGTLALNTAADNTAVGAAALLLNTTGNGNTAIGVAALLNNTTPSGNTAIGDGALLSNTTGGTLGTLPPNELPLGPNVAVGQQALQSNTLASSSVAVGYQALASFVEGPIFPDPINLDARELGANTAVGFQALAANVNGYGNSAFGYQALHNADGDASNFEGVLNTAIGIQALFNNETGSSNVAMGNIAGLNIVSGSDNICIGRNAGVDITTADNVICIGADVDGADVSDRCFIGNIYSNVQPIVGTNPDSVTITMSGRLGRGDVSSRRYKHDIKPMDNASELLYALKPVSFRYNREYDDTQTLAFGLIAEEVAEVYPDLVGRNRDGQPESVRYQQINAMLLNEFLKEHRRVEQLKKDFESKIAEQQKQIETLAAGLQKVSTQLELSKSAPEMVFNH